MKKPGRKVKKSPNTIAISHDYARQQEINTAEYYGGYPTSQSGAGNIKGDVRIKGKHTIECKCTINNSYALKYDYLEKMMESAASLGEDFFLQLHFIDENGYKKRGYIIIPEDNIKETLRDG